jgi:hypothetical protein
MNCEDYRQAISAEPSFDGGASHVSECADCQAFRRKILALDSTIASALSIDVPELRMPELAEIDNVVSIEPSRRRIAPVWLAAAATIVIGAVLGFRMIGNDVVYESLADEIVAHLDYEPAALVVTDTPVSDGQLSDVVPASIAQLDHSAGLITYAQSCEINGKTVPHLVMQGQSGPVTILLMPDEKISAAVDLSGEHIRGVLLPVGNGSIAIIGDRSERLAPIRESVVNSVMWDT